MPQDKTPAPMQGRQSPPFFRSMQREMSELFDRFRDLQRNTPGEFFEALTAPMFPALDVVEDEKAIEITAEIPGVKEEDLDVSITRDVLTLKGKKSSEHEAEEQDFHMIERRYGSFRRSVPLGFMPEDDAVEASFSDGVLKLKIAKPETPPEDVRKIKVEKG